MTFRVAGAVAVFLLALVPPDALHAQVRFIVGTGGNSVSPVFGAPMSRPWYYGTAGGFGGFGGFVQPGYPNYGWPAAYGAYGAYGAFGAYGAYGAYNFAIPYPSVSSYTTVPTGANNPGPVGGTGAVFGGAGTMYRGDDDDTPLPPRMREAAYARGDQGASNRAQVHITVPRATAQLWVGGQPVESFGVSRRFVTPPLDSGRYAYDVRVRWVDGGQVHTQTQTVHVRPGGSARVIFPTPGR
jgi:uncharacterized protein (TIGR03000 family)